MYGVWISRKTGYKWQERCRTYGLKSLKELSRRPMSCLENVLRGDGLQIPDLLEGIKHSLFSMKIINYDVLLPFVRGFRPQNKS